MEYDVRLGRFLDGIEAWGHKAEEFASSEIPAYVSELLLYHAVCAVFFACASAIGLAVLSYAAWKLMCLLASQSGPSSADGSSLEGLRFFVWILLVSCAVYSFSLLVINCGKLVKIWLAPRVYVVDHVRSVLDQ